MDGARWMDGMDGWMDGVRDGWMELVDGMNDYQMDRIDGVVGWMA